MPVKINFDPRKRQRVYLRKSLFYTVFLIVFSLVFPALAAAQAKSSVLDNAGILSLIEKVQIKSKRSRAAYLSEYERKFSLTIERENTRMPEGIWLFKKIRLETVANKQLFPNLKDNWQFDFFGYKKYEVDVKYL